MSTIRINSQEIDGTIKLLATPTEDLRKYFHPENVMSVLGQNVGNEGVGVKAAFVSINENQGEPFEGEVLVLLAVKTTDTAGNPLTFFEEEEGDVLALSCLPYRFPRREFLLKKL